MKAEKDPKTGKWLVQYRYTDWQDKRRKSTKRGFATKREVEEWLRNFLMTKSLDFNMKFKDFIELYCEDMRTRLREHTMRTKRYIIDLKITPYFGEKSVNEIKATDIRQWQNKLISQGYSQTYLKTINNQLCAIFNYAVKYEEVYTWLAENAYKYGFVLRYPMGKQEITETSYEPWHYRYVGEEAALEIYEQGICLEEYYE